MDSDDGICAKAAGGATKTAAMVKKRRRRKGATKRQSDDAVGKEKRASALIKGFLTYKRFTSNSMGGSGNVYMGVPNGWMPDADPHADTYVHHTLDDHPPREFELAIPQILSPVAPVPINSIAAAQEHYSLYGQTYGAVVNMNPNPIDNTTGAAFFPYAHDDQQQQQHQNRSRSLTPSSATLARHYLDQQQQQCQFQHQSPQHFTSATLGRLSSSQQRRPVLHHVTAANSSSNLIDGERWVSSARGGGPSTTPPRHFTTSSAIEDEMNEAYYTYTLRRQQRKAAAASPAASSTSKNGTAEWDTSTMASCGAGGGYKPTSKTFA